MVESELTASRERERERDLDRQRPREAAAGGKSERAVMTVMLITGLFASCAEAALLTHDADSFSLRAKVTELMHSDTQSYNQL